VLTLIWVYDIFTTTDVVRQTKYDRQSKK